MAAGTDTNAVRELDPLRHAGRSGKPRPLTARQRDVLGYLEEFIREHRFPPTLREVSTACRLGGPSGAHRVLRALERKGYISRTGKLNRAFTLVLPTTDYTALSSPDRLLVCITYLLLSAHRDRILATGAHDLAMDIKSILVRDAYERHSIVVQLAQGLDQIPEEMARAREILADFIPLLRGDSDWPTFVVDHLVMNRGSVFGGDVLAGEAPFVQGLFVRLARLCEQALQQAEGWLSELSESLSPRERARLRERAALMVRMCKGTIRLAEGSRRDLLPGLAREFKRLPPPLTR